MIYTLIQSTLRTSIWIALALGLAACASGSSQDSEATSPVDADSEPLDAGQLPPTPTLMRKLAPLPTMTTMPALSLPDLGAAPDITNDVWLNSDQPLNLAALQGKVVLVEFWTFG